MQNPAANAPKPGRSRIFWPFAALGVLALAWTGFWFFMAHRTDSVMTDWIEREANHGRVWSCPDRKTSGYPFRIEVRCAAPGFTGPAGQRSVAGSLGSLAAFAQVYQPSLILADIDGPLQLKFDDGARVDLAWSRLRLSLRGTPQTLDRFSIQGADAVLTASAADQPLFEMRAGEFEAHVRQSLDRQDSAYDLALSLRRAVTPALDAFLGLNDPADVDFAGAASHLAFAVKGSLAERLEVWRAAGGRLEPASLDVRKGQSRLRLNGGLGLDAAHRLEGKLTLEGDGLQPLFKRFGLNLDMVAAGNLLDGLLGAKPKADGEKRAGLRLPLTLDRGRVAVGPLRTPIALPPLY